MYSRVSCCLRLLDIRLTLYIIYTRFPPTHRQALSPALEGQRGATSPPTISTLARAAAAPLIEELVHEEEGSEQAGLGGGIGVGGEIALATNACFRSGRYMPYAEQ